VDIRGRRRIKQLERWLKRFNPDNPYMAFFHIGTSEEEVKKARQELKILKQQRGINHE
tara:strand:- start:5301 stop:5474 length:174 start_codon:yes stop_codon:yes gene_type:complete